MARRRRTLKRYQDLYRDPATLFTAGPDSHGPVNVTLWPNGESEIWLQTPDGYGVKLRAGSGPHGFSIQIDTFAGSPDITIAAPDPRHIELCQYRQDAKSQAFKRWYLEQPTDDDIALLGESYRRKVTP